jgi:hypothetical protein
MTGREPDLTKVTPVAQLEGEDEDERLLLSQLVRAAETYLSSFEWCEQIQEKYAGIAVPGVIGVFLVHIAPTRPEVDEWLWVIVGDVPPAYITLDDCPNAATALDGYIGAMQEWVDAAKEGRSVDELIPVNVPATPAYAEMLGSRLQFLDSRVLSEYKDDLAEM